MTMPDSVALAGAVIADRNLERNRVTGERGKLRFGPGRNGDAKFIVTTVRNLDAESFEALRGTAEGIRTSYLHAGLRALYINPDREDLSDAHKAAAALGLLVAELLGVNVPV